MALLRLLQVCLTLAMLPFVCICTWDEQLLLYRATSSARLHVPK